MKFKSISLKKQDTKETIHMFSVLQTLKFAWRFLCHCVAESLCLLPVGCGVLCRNNKNCEFKCNCSKKHLHFLWFPLKDQFPLEKYWSFSLAISRAISTVNYSCPGGFCPSLEALLRMWEESSEPQRTPYAGHPSWATPGETHYHLPKASM